MSSNQLKLPREAGEIKKKTNLLLESKVIFLSSTFAKPSSKTDFKILISRLRGRTVLGWKIRPELLTSLNSGSYKINFLET